MKTIGIFRVGGRGLGVSYKNFFGEEKCEWVDWRLEGVGGVGASCM